MGRKLATIALISLPALLVALGGVHLVMRDRSYICATVAGRPPCKCGCRNSHGDPEVEARATRMAAESGVAILLLLALATGGLAALFAADARRTRRRSEEHRAFVAGISHRLRTPLTGICLNADLLKEGRLADAAGREEAVAAIAEKSAQLTGLVEQLLDHVAKS